MKLRSVWSTRNVEDESTISVKINTTLIESFCCTIIFTMIPVSGAILHLLSNQIWSARSSRFVFPRAASLNVFALVYSVTYDVGQQKELIQTKFHCNDEAVVALAKDLVDQFISSPTTAPSTAIEPSATLTKHQSTSKSESHVMHVKLWECPLCFACHAHIQEQSQREFFVEKINRPKQISLTLWISLNIVCIQVWSSRLS